MDAGNSLRLHRLVLRISLAAGNAFAWIFVFQYFYIIGGTVGTALAQTAVLYAISQTATCLLTPYAARGLRHGMRREIIFAVLLASAAFVFLGAIFEGYFGPLYTLAIIGFALMLGTYRALYWVPYEVERHNLHASSSRLSYEVLIALMPAFVGYLLAFDGVYLAWVLFGAATLMLVSLLPLMRIPDTYERFPWSYRETYGHLLARAHRRLFWGAIIDGMQGAALLLIWPLAVFIVIGWSYPLYGVIFSFTFLLLIVVRETVERHLQHVRLLESMPMKIAIVSSAWVARLVVVNPLSIVATNSYAHVGDPKISTDQAAFEQVPDGGHFIDEYTVLREIGLSLGRALLCVVFATLATIFALPFVFGVAFVIAAFAAGLSVAFSQAPRPTI